MNNARPRLIAVMLSRILGLVARLALRRARHPTRRIVFTTTRASPAKGVGQVETQRVMGKARLSLARAARRGIQLLPRPDGVARGSLWAISILVIVIYLINSFAQSGSGTVAPSVQSLSHDPVPTPAMSVRLLETRPPDSMLAVRYALAHYADTPGSWRFSDPSIRNSGHDQGKHVPFMLRIENAIPGSTYTFDIRYHCAHSGGNGYDFLSSYDRDRGMAPAHHRDGPGTVFSDTTLAIPDDPSIPFDDGDRDRTFKLWGGSFASSAAGPSPESLCLPERGQKAQKTYTVAIRARAETAYLLWSGHLASGVD